MDTSASSSLSSGPSPRKLSRLNSQQVGIPLVPQPRIDCNIPDLENAASVNVVYEKDNKGDTNSAKYFRISDENNKEICKFMECTRRENVYKRQGIKYLECQDSQGKCIMLVAYPVGLGEVALLSANEELIGECQSNVEFVCLSVKVKYNFYDAANGQRIMKMTAIMPEDENERKFTLMVKRSKNDKMALIKMGLLKSCCHIKFKLNQTSCAERLQIIALWTGFMHNELVEREASILAKRHAETEKRRKESLVNNPADSCQQSNSQVINDNQTPCQNDATQGATKRQNSLKIWKNLVRSRLPSTRRINNNNDFDAVGKSKR